MRRPESIVLVAVGLHLVLSAAHGVVHGIVPVPIPIWQLGIVVGGLFVLPILGTAAFLAGRQRAAAGLILLGTLVSVVFEAVAHFGVANPDHVSSVSHGAFTPTAVGSTVATGVAAVAAAWYLQGQAHGGSVRSAGESRT